MNKPTVLTILDGFGYREETAANAIAAASTPTWNKLWRDCPHTLLAGCGEVVGLPQGQMGNSEVGHLSIGAGRVVLQDFTRIQAAITDGSFFTNPILAQAVDVALAQDKAIHILGLLSPGGVHSHEDQLLAMLKFACQRAQQKGVVAKVYLHAFLDGRDMPPKSAQASLAKAQAAMDALGCGKIASLIGRYYAMDRDQRWNRVAKAYDLLTLGVADYHVPEAEQALDAAYARAETDEFVAATAIGSGPAQACAVQDGDVVVFMNYRADRARELTRAFIEPDFDGFTRQAQPKLAAFVSLTEYATDLPTQIAFPPLCPQNNLGEWIAVQGLKQLRLAETEKYAHVTFFFNGGSEQAFPNEKRILVPSPRVKTYDLQPEMSAVAVTDTLVQAIKSQQYAFIVCNYANADMVGHTGDFAATVTAIETIDQCLQRITEALDEVSGEMIVTADHGNAELMYDPITQQVHTAHTHEPVPFVYYGRPAKAIAQYGTLADIAPTILYLMGFAPPQEMTGHVLLELE